MKRNIFLSLLIFLIIVILNCILGITSAQEKSIIIRIDNREYQVQADGAVVKYDGTVVQDTSIIEKAHYTAIVTRERITESRYNQVVFAPVTKTMIDLQSLVKPLAGGYAYVLLSSTDITSSLLEGVAKGGPTGAFGNIAKEVTKDLILEVTKELVEHPEKTAMKMADDAYALGLQAYRENYATYRSVTKEGYILSYDDAVNFMANEQQKELLGVAVQLIRDINSKKYQVGQYSEDSHENQEIKQKILKLVADMKSESLGTKVDIAIFMTEFKPIFEEALSGLENYKPYIDFEERVSSLNNAFSKTEYAYYQYKKPSELDTFDVAETNWDNSTILPPSEGSAKPEMITWEKTFGESGNDMANDIIQTTDGGYVLVGYTESKGSGDADAWIFKLDSKGKLLWEKTFGGSEFDGLTSIIQTTDGGYALAGGTESKGSGDADAWILKLDSQGDILWDRTYGGFFTDWAKTIIQTDDGGYAFVGARESKWWDAWVVKLNNKGDVVWDKIFGKSGKWDEGSHIIQTIDGGYAVSGAYNKSGAFDYWIIKLDSQGNLIWDRNFGGEHDDITRSIIQTNDGGYILPGFTYFKGAGGRDAWIIKLDIQGNILWDKTYGSSKDDVVNPIIKTNDGSYVLSGYTKSKGAGESDIWILKLDSKGNLLWNKTYGGSNFDEATSLIQTIDGGYAIAGYTAAKGEGGADVWIIKLDEQGNLGEITEGKSIFTDTLIMPEILTWAKTLGEIEDDRLYSLIQNDDGGYIVAGSITSKDAGSTDALVLKLDKESNIVWDDTYGKSDNDETIYSIIKTIDGNYMLGGITESEETGKDFWLLKIDNQGNRLWDKTYGGNDYDEARSIIQTTDGGYAAAGYTESKGAGREDVWIIKVNSQGNIIWDKTYGGSKIDMVSSIIQTTDGGYIVAGSTASKGAGSLNFWILKLDEKGDLIWDRTFGGRGSEMSRSIIQTNDGGYAVAGYTSTKGFGLSSFWILRIDEKGNLLWDKTFGESGHNDVYSFIQTNDGGYAVAGYTQTKNENGLNMYIVKLDSQGNKLWDKTYGGNDYDEARSIIQTTDGGYAVAGYTESKGARVADSLILKLDRQGNLSELIKEELFSHKVFDISNEKINITSVINMFVDAMNNQNWAKAKEYCFTNSYADRDVDDTEYSIEHSDITMNLEIIINDIEIDGINAKVDCTQKVIPTQNGEIMDEISVDAILLFENINNQWKLYKIENNDQ